MIFCNGFIQRAGLAIQVLEYFFIANCLQGIVVAIGQQTFHFFDEPLVDHVVYPVVDAAVQLFLGQVQADLADVKGTLPAGAAAKAEDRPARGEADFERAQQSLGVLSFAFGEEGGVMEVHFLLEPADTVELILQLELAADGGINGGDLIEAIGKGLDIEPGAARP